MAFWTSSPRKSAPASPLEDLRARYDALFQKFGGLPDGVTVTPGQMGPIAGEWLRPQGWQNDKRAILYFHGGGGIAGSPQSHRGLAGRLVAASGVAAFVPAYRLAPECFFPAAVRDGIDVYRALLTKGHDGGGIVLAGDEAGGGLAFAVTLAIRNAGLDMPAGVAALSPWADFSLSGLSVLTNAGLDRALNWEMLFLCARHVLRKSNPCDAYASPAYAALKDFPPVMVHAGANEILRDDASKLGDRAAESGVPVSVEIYDGMGHLFQADAAHDEAKVSLTRLGNFIKMRASS